MPEYVKPTLYLDRLLLAQRAIKAAQYRPDAKVALREVCEGLNELLIALVEREQGREGQAASRP